LMFIGKGGIRTLDSVHYIDVPGLYLNPLGHFSVQKT
jgi:hypothetical protein